MVEILSFAAAIALWLVASGGPTDGAARWVGELVFHLLAAMLIRWLWIRPQKPKPAFWAPSLFAIAAGIALLGRFGPSAA